MTRLMVGVTVVVTGIACFAGGLSVPKPREVVVVRSPPPDCGTEIKRLRAELDRREGVSGIAEKASRASTS